MAPLLPPHPPEILLELWDKLSSHKKGAQINGILVKNIQTGIETSDTRVKLLNYDVVVYDDWWYKIGKYLKVEVGYNYIAKIKEEYFNQIIAWRAYIKRHEEDYTTYLRLKERFESKGE
jgi:hypothetical protein